MKKYLLLLAILVMKNCAGQFTTSGRDTLCIPIDTLKKVYTAALQKKAVDSLNIILNGRIASLNVAIGLLQEKDSASVKLFNDQLQIMREQKLLYQDQLNSYERLLKREKRKRFWTSVGGTLATGIVSYLLITK